MPFIYAKELDLLLSSSKPIIWWDVQNNQLLPEAILLALLAMVGANDSVQWDITDLKKMNKLGPLMYHSGRRRG